MLIQNISNKANLIRSLKFKVLDITTLKPGYTLKTEYMLNIFINIM